MRILFLSSVCSSIVFQKIFDRSLVKPLQSVQKVHRLLLEGFPMNVRITALSTPPVWHMKRRFVRIRQSVEENISYIYIPIINILFLRTILIVLYSFIHSFKWMITKRKEKSVVVCDIFSFWSSLSALLVSKLFGVKSVVIVTDLPQLVHTMSERKVSCFSVLYWTEFFASKLLSYFDAYILFAEAMNDVVNKKQKPYMVMEGLVDGRRINKFESHKNRNNADRLFEFMYCGGLYEKYGLKNLIEAFTLIENKNIRLSLFGSGDMVEDIIHYIEKDKRIMYGGVLLNEEIVNREYEANVLVNPRFTDEPLAKYSFPSKNMEYMSSGTPVLTTRLPGMPLEYNEYVFFIEDESVAGMKTAMERLLLMDRRTLKKRGLEALEFVRMKKSNLVQAGRILDFVLSV